eukprot:5988967-Amphidinium_carterae.3
MQTTQLGKNCRCDAHDSQDASEVGGPLRAACGTAAALSAAMLPKQVRSLELCSTASSPAASLATKLQAGSLTTVQCYGLDRNARVEDLVAALNAEGFGGDYNYVCIPRRLHLGKLDALGYAFINFTSSERAALIVTLWAGRQKQHACFPRRVRFKIAAQQGYHQNASERSLQRYEHIRKKCAWPLVMSEDGSNPIFGTEAAKAMSQSPNEQPQSTTGF